MDRKEMSKLINAFDLPSDVVVNKIINDLKYRICKNCKYGTEEDGPSYDCHMSRDYFGHDHVCLPIDYGCNKFVSKDIKIPEQD